MQMKFRAVLVNMLLLRLLRLFLCKKSYCSRLKRYGYITVNIKEIGHIYCVMFASEMFNIFFDSRLLLTC